MNKELEAIKDLNELSLEFNKLHIAVYGKSICTHEHNLFRHIKQAPINKNKEIKELKKENNELMHCECPECAKIRQKKNDGLNKKFREFQTAMDVIANKYNTYYQ